LIALLKTWSVIISLQAMENAVRSSHLLANHDANGDKSSVSIALDGPHLTLQVPERSSTDKPPLKIL